MKPHYYSLHPREQFRIAKPDMYYIHRYLKSWEYVAELTETMNIHFHGIIGLRKEDYKEYRKVIIALKSCFGHIKIKKCKDRKGWLKYMYKSFSTTSSVIKPESPIISVDSKEREIRQDVRVQYEHSRFFRSSEASA